MLNVLIIDDEPLARENLKALLEEDPMIQIVGEMSNAIEGISAINKLHPDVVFLDIQMPRITGLEMVTMLDPEQMPYIVFVTAYDEYAIKAFEEHAFDYILKPIEQTRLNKTLQRLHQKRPKQNLKVLDQDDVALKYIPCTGHSRIYLISLSEIFFVGSKVTGVYVTKKDGVEYFTELTLKILEDRTPLIRCHRQYLINLQHLREIRFDSSAQAEAVFAGELTVPISRRYLKSLKEKLGLKF